MNLKMGSWTIRGLQVLRFRDSTGEWWAPLLSRRARDEAVGCLAAACGGQASLSCHTSIELPALPGGTGYLGSVFRASGLPPPAPAQSCHPCAGAIYNGQHVPMASIFNPDPG